VDVAADVRKPGAVDSPDSQTARATGTDGATGNAVGMVAPMVCTLK
jgi:hypothetical protein